MSNQKRVADLVKELGRATTDDLCPRLPDLTKAQILSALNNGHTRRLVKLGEIGGRAGQRKGSRPATWVPWSDADDDEPDVEVVMPARGSLAHIGRVNSVFALGAA